MIDILLIIGLLWFLWKLIVLGVGNCPSEETERKWLRQMIGIGSWKKKLDRLERKIERKRRRK